VGVTGTPGTGKKSVAPLMARQLGLGCLGLNDYALSHVRVAEPDREWEVDTQELRKRLRRDLHSPTVVYGHLLPQVLSLGSVARVVVLRCEPAVLKERLRDRGYPKKKLVDNLEAELIGLVSSDAFDAFGPGKTFEVDTTISTPAEAALFATRVVRGEAQPGPRIDWTESYDSGRKLRSLLSGEG